MRMKVQSDLHSAAPRPSPWPAQLRAAPSVRPCAPCRSRLKMKMLPRSSPASRWRSASGWRRSAAPRSRTACGWKRYATNQATAHHRQRAHRVCVTTFMRASRFATAVAKNTAPPWPSSNVEPRVPKVLVTVAMDADDPLVVLAWKQLAELRENDCAPASHALVTRPTAAGGVGRTSDAHAAVLGDHVCGPRCQHVVLDDSTATVQRFVHRQLCGRLCLCLGPSGGAGAAQVC